MHLIQSCPKQVQGASQVLLDGVAPDAEPLSNFLMAQFLELAQYENLAALGRQRLHGIEEAVQPFAGLEDFIRPRSGAWYLFDTGVVCTVFVAGLRPTLVIRGEIEGDPVKQGARILRLLPKFALRQPPVGLLKDIRRRVDAAEALGEYAPDFGVMGFYQRGEG